MDSWWKLGTGRYFLGSAGIQTSAIAFGGNPPALGVATTEKYDGTSWSSSSDMATARSELAGSGTLTAGLAFGGKVYPPGGVSNATEEFTSDATNITISES